MEIYSRLLWPLAKVYGPAYTRKMTTRRFLLLVLTPVLLCLAAWTGWWFYAAHFAIGAFQNWAQEQRAGGWELNFARIDTAGYPFFVRLEVKHFGVSAPGRLWSVSGEEVEIAFRPWEFHRYRLRAEKPVRFVSGALAGSRETPLQAGRVSGEYIYDAKGQTHRAYAALDNVTGPNRIAVKRFAMNAERPFTPAIDAYSDVLSLRAEAVSATIPGILPPELPSHFPAVILDASLSGPEPDVKGSAFKRLEIWRAAGGQIEVRELALLWEELNLQGDGVLTVDAAMRPAATFTLQAAGVRQTARRAEKTGLIDKDTRRFIELGAGLLSLGGSSSAIQIPVSIKDGIVYLGPAPVGRVDPLIPGYAPVRPPEPVAPPKAPVESIDLPPPPPTVSDRTLNLETTE